MVFFLATIATVMLGFSEILAMTAAGTFTEKLEWPDYVVLVVPPLVLESIVISFVFLPLSVAIVSSLVLVAGLLWSVMALLKLPTRKRAG